jgi:hypothetical protein
LCRCSTALWHSALLLLTELWTRSHYTAIFSLNSFSLAVLMLLAEIILTAWKFLTEHCIFLWTISYCTRSVLCSISLSYDSLSALLFRAEVIFYVTGGSC